MIKFWIFALLLPTIALGNQMPPMHLPPAIAYDASVSKVSKTNAEWKALLPYEQYVILREKGTERAFSGKYDKFYEKGTYVCAACGNPIFSSETKFDSGTGWPSFWEPMNPHSIITQSDNILYFITRTEVLCHRCDSHLGHVFNDGPPPTGLRYCMNSLALTFEPYQKTHSE